MSKEKFVCILCLWIIVKGRVGGERERERGRERGGGGGGDMGNEWCVCQVC